MDKKFVSICVPLIVIFVIAFLFHLRLFCPSFSLYSTPDFDQSDIVHVYYPIKKILFDSIRNKSLPLWTPYDSGGYALFADGQIGLFYIPNLIIYYIFPFVLATNVLFVLSFFLSGVGTFLFCKEINIKNSASLFAAIVMMLSGFYIMQITHISLLQAAVLIPLLFYLVQRYLNRRRFADILLFSLLLSQQIYCGHQEITSYTILSLTLYIIFWSLIHNRKHELLKNIIFFGCGLIIAGVLSSALLLPSIELYMKANYAPQHIFSYPISSLLFFIHPFIFGNPANGTYIHDIYEKGIYWENMGFVGYVPILLCILAIFTKKSVLQKLFIVLTIVYMVFVFGTSSPLLLIFSLFPFSMFRVPSRMLVMVSLCIAVFSALYLQKYSKWIIIILCLIQVATVFVILGNYHSVSTYSEVFGQNKITRALSKSNKRVYIIEDGKGWNDIFTKRGWQNMKEYLPFYQSLPTQSSLVYSIPRMNSVSKFLTRRNLIFQQLMRYYLSAIDKHDKKFAQFLGHSSIGLLLAPKEYEKQIPWKKIASNSRFVLLKNPVSSNRVQFYTKYKTVSTIEQMSDFYLKENSFLDTALIEEKPYYQSTSSLANSFTYSWQKMSDMEIILSTRSDANGLLVLKDNYYPGWNVFIDGKKGSVMPVNIWQRGVWLKRGKHTVRFIYEPLSFRIGAVISICGFICVGLYFSFRAFLKNRFS